MSFKRILLTAVMPFCLVGFMTQANAQVGETQEVFDTTFGSSKINDPLRNATIYLKGGYKIIAAFADGRAKSVSYQRMSEEGPLPISAAEAESLLKHNGVGVTWLQTGTDRGGESWRSSDGSLSADYKAEDKRLDVMLGRETAESPKATPSATPTTPQSSTPVQVAATTPVTAPTPATTSGTYYAALPGSLQKAKERLAAGDPSLSAALNELIQAADKALKETPPSVTEKKKPAPSHDPHDYASLAPYFWPGPNGSLPYVRHDGKVNPESKDPDFNDDPRVGHMSKAVDALALAYYFTGKETYAEKAVKFIRTWFLDPATYMNPNMDYAQGVRGKTNGRSEGVLEARSIAIAADALGLLNGSVSFTEKDRQGMKEWLEKYYNWLTTSEAGKGEHAAKNNHGTWCDVQAARIAMCLGHNEDAKRIVTEAEHLRVGLQIEDNGSQPFELSRTAAFSYSWFNLDALTELATIGRYAGADLWNYSDGKKGIRGAIEFMLPYVDVPAKDWPYQQIKERKENAFLSILHQASVVYADPKFDAVVAKYPDAASMPFQLLFVK